MVVTGCWGQEKKRKEKFDFVPITILSTRSHKDCTPFALIDDILTQLEKATYFSSMDMLSGYFQVPLSQNDVPKTAFCTQDGLFEFLRMPFGLTNAPANFQMLMDSVLGGLKWTAALLYLDDVIVFGTTFDEHLERLHQVKDALKKGGLTVQQKNVSSVYEEFVFWVTS